MLTKIFATKEAHLHTHAAYTAAYGTGNDNFSKPDKKVSNFFRKPFYMATPAGILKKYDPYTQNVTILSSDIPFDPNHPEK